MIIFNFTLEMQIRYNLNDIFWFAYYMHCICLFIFCANIYHINLYFTNAVFNICYYCNICFVTMHFVNEIKDHSFMLLISCCCFTIDMSGRLFADCWSLHQMFHVFLLVALLNTSKPKLILTSWNDFSLCGCTMLVLCCDK